MIKSTVEFVFEYATTIPNKTAFICKNEKVSYCCFATMIRQAALVLKNKGMKEGNKVMIGAKYDKLFLAFYFAIHLIDCTAIVFDADSKKSYETIKKEINPNLLIGAFDSNNSYQNLFSQFDKEYEYSMKKNHIADILYTTGTTGKAKGVMLSHENEYYGAQNVINGGEMVNDDVNLLTMPLYHAFGLTTMRACLVCGSTFILQNGFSSLKEMYQNVKKNTNICVYMVPAALNILYQQTKNRLDLMLGNVKKIEFCTAPISYKMKAVLLQQLSNVKLYNSYGATESARTVYMRIEDKGKMGAVGKPVKGVGINIVDEKRNIITSSPKVTGYLSFRGKMNMIGYYGDSDLTDTVLDGEIYYSSDIGYIDRDGYVYVIGRDNDVINSGGEKFSPSEIEGVANEYLGIKESVCVGMKDPDGVLGFVPVLFVEQLENNELDEKSLLEYLKEYLEGYMVPKRIIVIDEIPRNRIGKIDRNVLRKYIEERED